MMAIRSMNNSNEEKWRLEKDLENCNISSESFEDQEKGDDDEDNDNNEAVPESNDTITKVQEEDNNDDDENNVCQDFACKQCSAQWGKLGGQGDISEYFLFLYLANIC